MKRRTMIGAAAALGGGLVAGVGAFAFAGHGGRPEFMRRMASAVIDDALDHAKVTAEQRATIHGIRDRVFTALAEQRQARGARLQGALALFEADTLDPARVEALRRQGEDDHRRIADTIAQAIADVHATLTPEQRRAVAEYVRSHRRHHFN